MLIVGTRAHLEDLERSYTYAEDVSVTAVAVGTFFGGVGSLLPGGSRPVWALLDKERTVAVGEFDVTPLTRLPQANAQAMAAATGGLLLVGLAGAHLCTVSSDGVVTDIEAFEHVEGRDSWSNPAAATPDLRSIAISESDVWFVNVHVGGLWRSDDHGESWHNVLPAENDVHEVVTSGTGDVAVAAAIGFGWSRDGGASWQWTTEGLHASYCRAVALDGDTAFVTTSTGPTTTDGRLYRSQLGGGFEQCSAGLPESFPFNIDSGSLTASSGEVAFGTRKGEVYRSRDSGTTWEISGEGMRPVQVLRFA